MPNKDEFRIFIQNDETHEVVWEGKDRAAARRFLRSNEAKPGTYNILGRVELGLLVEPPKVTRGNRVYRGQTFRLRASKKNQIPENNVDPDVTDDGQIASV